MKHSYWEWDPDGVDWGIGAWVCHNCHQKNENLGHNSTIDPKQFSGAVWCPQCGAKMDGGPKSEH